MENTNDRAIANWRAFDQKVQKMGNFKHVVF